MAERHSATGNVHLGRVQAEQLFVGAHDHRKGLVDLVQRNVAHAEAGHLESARDGDGRSRREVLGRLRAVREACGERAHEVGKRQRVHSAKSMRTTDASERLDAELLHLAPAHEDQGTRAVVQLGRVGRRDRAALLLEGRTKGRNLVKADARGLLVLGDNDRLLALWTPNGDGHDLAGKQAGL